MKSRMIVKQVQRMEKIMKSGVQKYIKVKMSDDAANYVVLTFDIGECPFQLGDVVDVQIVTKLAARQEKLPGISPLVIEIEEEEVSEIEEGSGEDKEEPEGGKGSGDKGNEGEGR